MNENNSLEKNPPTVVLKIIFRRIKKSLTKLYEFFFFESWFLQNATIGEGGNPSIRFNRKKNAICAMLLVMTSSAKNIFKKS